MYRQMRRKDREISENEAYEILNRAEYGVLANINADNTPYCVPLSFVLLNGKIYFHCAKAGQKLDNIGLNPSVCFNVVSFCEPVEDNGNYSTYFESATVFGSALTVENQEERKEALFKLTEKYFPGNTSGFENSFNATADKMEIVVINIERITGKAKKKG